MKLIQFTLYSSGTIASAVHVGEVLINPDSVAAIVEREVYPLGYLMGGRADGS